MARLPVDVIAATSLCHVSRCHGASIPRESVIWVANDCGAG